MNSFKKGRVVPAPGRRGWLARVLVGVACAGLLAATACDDDEAGISNPTTLSTIVVSPGSQTIAVNGTQQFTAAGKNSSGGSVAITPVWSVVSGGGTISSSGMFTAGTTAGTFTSTIKATSGTTSSTATVIVTAGALASIAVTPSPAPIGVGAAQQFVAVGKDASGNVVAFTPTWSVVAGGGTVNTTGMFTAGTVPGTFTNTVQASGLGVNGTATVTVAAGPVASIVLTPTTVNVDPGLTRQFTSVGKDASGNTTAITTVWSVVAGGGTIDANGLFTAGTTAGTFTNTIKATSGLVSSTATVVVVVGGGGGSGGGGGGGGGTGSVATITVSPNPTTVSLAGVRTFTAVGTDASGNVVAITPQWSVVATGGTIDASTGVFTAGAVAGTFVNTVRATAGGVSGFATVNVSGGSVTSITVSPSSPSVQVNGAQTFTALGKDAFGNTISITPTWAVVNGGGAIDANTGSFTAGITPGTYSNTIRATANGVQGFASVTVTAAPSLTTVIVLPNPASVVAGGTQQFGATGRDQNGNAFAVTPVWSVLNPAAGTINATTGLFTAGLVTGTYTNAVQALSGTNAGTATVIVTAAGGFVSPIQLGTAAADGIIAGQAVTCVNLGVINADVAISPGNNITGFGPCVITGVRHLNDAVAVQAQQDLTSTFNQLSSQPCPPANAIVANLGGTTKPAGVYCTASGIGVTGTLTLDGGGNSNALFIFQAGSSLTTAGNVILINGAQAKNVWWLVGSSATIGTASQWQGNIISLTSITLVDNATLNGRALARTGSVTLGTGNVITIP